MNTAALLNQLMARRDLSRAATREFFDALMENRCEPAVVAAVLTALAAKGESIDELVGAAEALRARVTPVRVPDGVAAIDTCGTGGDGQPVFNVSTTVAIVAAAAGATVAKHGNRSNARPSGSAEVLQALGVNIDADVPVLERTLAECRIAFLYAQRLHPAMKHAAPVRRALGVRTIFNLVGPLSNPAGVRRQLLGVNRPELVPTLLAALRRLGCESVMVVHGGEGLCDLSPAGRTLVGCWDGHTERVTEVDAEVAGCRRGALSELFVDGPERSAALVREVLDGRAGPAREMVVLNAAAALQVAALAGSWDEGARLARRVLDDGAARDVLARWVRRSHG